MTYANLIREDNAKAGFIGHYDPRHIEAFMRCEHGTLDSLSPAKFAAEVAVARECIDVGGKDGAEILAQSFGL